MYQTKSRNPLIWIAWGVGGVIIAALMALIFGLVVMWLWNWLMPTIFNLPELTYWQAWGLVILFHILFKSGCPGSKTDSSQHPTPHFGKEWKNKFRQKAEKYHENNGHIFDEKPNPDDEMKEN